MFEIQVRMADLYGNAYFSVETPSMDVECLKRAIEDVYDQWSKKLSKQGAGRVRVSYRGYCIATGSIIWWSFEPHTLQLEAANMEWVGGTSECPKYYPTSEQPSPACCGFV